VNLDVYWQLPERERRAFALGSLAREVCLSEEHARAALATQTHWTPGERSAWLRGWLTEDAAQKCNGVYASPDGR
jgi:hypothetical protein